MNAFGIFLAFNAQVGDLPTIEWRDALMRLFLKDISADGMNIINRSRESTNFCLGWEGIMCEGNKINEIKYSKFRHGNFNISALPHSTKIIRIQMSAQNFQIDTRSFPKSLKRLFLNVNEIHGRVDLTMLPKGLEVAYLWNNRLTGPIDLTKLPRTLRTLDLSQNKIQQETVWYADLPDHLQRIRLLESWDGNRINEVCVVESEDPVKNKSLFDGMRKSKVH